MTSNDLFSQAFSREQVMGGLAPTRRANTILFQIESHTAHLIVQSRQATELFLTEKTAQERDMAFIEAFTLGRNLPLKPTIQNLEQYAPQWANLIPDRPEMRAAIAHQLAAKYQFNVATAPKLRAALGLDTEPVQQAYLRFYDAPLASIYTSETTATSRLRWAWNRLGSWLEGLPPFWSVFALTITETIGASVLALPIALAGIGPLPGIVLLLIFGLANVLTVAYMAETASRSSNVRYGSSFIGQMITEYLGQIGAVLFSVSLLVLCLFVILAYYIGFATTLADITQVPPWIWVILLFGVGVYFVTRGSLNSTITVALVVGAINLVMLTALMLLSLPYVTTDNLTFVALPFIDGRPFDASLFQLVFGIVFTAFFGHLSVPNSARMVLRQDPSGGALVRGAMAAQVVVIIVYSLWVLVVNGAVSPQALANESGTALIPLAATVGPVAHIFGTVFIVLGLGVASIHFSLALYNLTREWLPQRQGPIITLARRQGHLRLSLPGQPAGLPQLSLIYLGTLGSQAQLRLDIETDVSTHYNEVTVADEWDAAATLARYPELVAYQSQLQLKLQILEAEPRFVRLRLKTPLELKYEADWDRLGLNMTDLLILPNEQSDLLNWMMRTGRTDLDQMAAYLGQTPTETQTCLAPLIEQGFIQVSTSESSLRYEVRMASTRSRRQSQQLAALVIDDSLATSTPAAQKIRRFPNFLERILDIALGERGRFWLGLTPLVVIFLAAQWQLFTGSESFAAPLSFVGVVVVALLAGVFPVLLLQASRRRGDIVPEVIYKLTGHPIFLSVIFILSLTGIVLHGLFVWEDALMRGLALLAAAAVIGLTINAWQRGAFTPRLVAELRGGASMDHPAHLTLIYNGVPLETVTHFIFTDSEANAQSCSAANHYIPKLAQLQSATIKLPVAQANEIKLLTHQITSEGNSLTLSIVAELDDGISTRQVNLKETSGEVVLPLDHQADQLTLTLKNDCIKERHSLLSYN